MIKDCSTMKLTTYLCPLIYVLSVMCACSNEETPSTSDSLGPNPEMSTTQPEVNQDDQNEEQNQTEEETSGESEDTSSVEEQSSEQDEDSAQAVEEETQQSEDDSFSLEFAPLDERGEVVANVEVDRYMGTWFEIATTPSIQQRVCYGTQAIYQFNEEEEWVDVTNRCYAGEPDGRLQEIMGRAEINDPDVPSKLTVFFFDQGSPYWIVALDGSSGEQPYQWAVVSVPGQQFIWILSRTPQLDERARSALNDYLIERGFTIERLIDTPQPNEVTP